MLDNIELPKPKNWQDFENIVLSYASLKWSGCNAVTYGSSGQNQNGVDIYVRDIDKGFIGIQCKRVTRLSFKSIEQEVAKADNFKPKLKHYIIATTLKRDAKLQEKVNVLSLERSHAELFTIDIIFWEDIVRVLNTDRKKLEQLFPQIFYTASPQNNITINSSNNTSSVINNVITFPGSLPLQRLTKKGEKRWIDETIGSDKDQVNYIRHLINRYKEFKKEDFEDKSQMNYSLIYKSIQREFGYKWDETPCELFEDLYKWLQKRIDNTRIGRINKSKGIKNYDSTCEEYLANRPKGKSKKK